MSAASVPNRYCLYFLRADAFPFFLFCPNDFISICSLDIFLILKNCSHFFILLFSFQILACFDDIFIFMLFAFLNSLFLSFMSSPIKKLSD